MNQLLPLTDDVFSAYLNCRYKAYLKLTGAVGEPSDFARLQHRLSAEYREGAMAEWLRRGRHEGVIESPASLPDAIAGGAPAITDALAADAGESCRLDALERVPLHQSRPAAQYSPVLFVRRERPSPDDRLLLGYGAGILTRIQGTPPTVGKIVHGSHFRVSRVELGPLLQAARSVAEEIKPFRDGTATPPLLLNKHCAECEFRRRCRAAAVEKDDLSLLGGLRPKEIAALHGRGIFTVTQYSYTFRPGRMKRAAEAAGKKHDHALQALAIREKTVYVAQRPTLVEGNVQVYLDVEGLPDEDFYYLIGLTVVEGNTRRELSLWADGKADEAAIWAAFLRAVGEWGEDFVLYHYGSYESKFLERMEARHGGDPGLLTRLRARSVNVLSLVYARVYFPVHANDLKSVAGCLGFRWSAPEPSGLQAIAWRYGWDATGDESLKRSLMAYNEEDRSALERVVEMLRCLGDEQGQSGHRPGPAVASVKEVPGPYRHKFGATKFALPEFARITKCAYFDYQRDKVLCRTSPRLRKTVRDKRGRKKRAWKVNREVEWGRPPACPHCGSSGLDIQTRNRKLVIDLRPFRGGLKREVTRHKACRYRCRKCLETFLPPGYLAMSCGYGNGVSAWVVYSSISLRQTDEAIAEALDEWFGVRFGRGYASKIRQRAVERYRPTYEALLAALRKGHLVHADETRAKIKGLSGDGYVWVFANPETVVYVYAPTRDGDTARDTLAGFKGVLVSDFYSAYDALDCPQQKCLVHLIRDINDDLLKNPFDGELKEQAARFTALLQAVVETIDRYGLRAYHLRKHKKDVDRFFATESKASYGSELALHYQQRFLKYRGKLFTFLDHDGVPWNNNTAENAVKRFVSRRKAMGTPFTEAGIRDYLLLLSLSQTLRYRNASFWKFLQSGETDIDAFLVRRR